MADERVVPEDLKALYNAAEVARDYADSRAQANQVLGLIERIADLQAKLEKMATIKEHLNCLREDHMRVMDELREYLEPEDEIEHAVIKLKAELQRLRDENAQFEANFSKRETHWIRENANLQRENAALKRPVTFTYDEIDELCCQWGEPRYLQTEDGEAWYWKFEGADLPVADNLAELLLAARQLLASRSQEAQKGATE